MYLMGYPICGTLCVCAFAAPACVREAVIIIVKHINHNHLITGSAMSAGIVAVYDWVVVPLHLYVQLHMHV